MTAQVMVFRCGGEAAATKNNFFMFFSPLSEAGFGYFLAAAPKRPNFREGVPPKAAGEPHPPRPPLLAFGQERGGGAAEGGGGGVRIH